MADPTPRVAVVVPCYNDGTTLPATIDSVRRQDEACELVIVDDGSSDLATLAILEEVGAGGIQVVRQANAGLSAARMAGVDGCQARYVIPLDADDLLVPGAVRALADSLDAHPDHCAAWGRAIMFGDASRPGKAADRLDPWRVTFYNGIPYCAMFRRAELQAAGGWQLNVGGYEDWDLWMSLAERGCRGLNIQRPVMLYRVHGHRMWRAAASKHDQIYVHLRSRHPKLFAERPRNWRRSEEPWRLKLALPALAALPLPSKARRRAFTAIHNPKGALWLLRAKARRGLNQ